MDKAGRVVIPKEVRDRIGASHFDLEVVLGRIELTPQAGTEGNVAIVEKDGIWIVEVPEGSEGADVVEAIRLDREERSKHLSGQ